MAKMRGLAMLNALFKWYLACLTALMIKATKVQDDVGVLVIGGKKGCQATMVISPL